MEAFVGLVGLRVFGCTSALLSVLCSFLTAFSRFLTWERELSDVTIRTPSFVSFDFNLLMSTDLSPSVSNRERAISKMS
jgi:hypothetical protein